ncbi:MAG: hypothetical protein ACK4WN_04430 [Aphanizomenon sp.]|jgi:hypothetical protein
MSCEYTVAIKFGEQYTRYVSLPRSSNPPSVSASSQCAAYGVDWGNIISNGGPFHGGLCLHKDERIIAVNAFNCNSPDEKDGPVEILEPYDNINGSCTSQRTYKTPGAHRSLAACQASIVDNSCKSPNICVPPDYCPPGMVCLPSSEFSEISGLASSLENSVCS